MNWCGDCSRQTATTNRGLCLSCYRKGLYRTRAGLLPDAELPIGGALPGGFWANVYVGERDECWPWGGAISTNGYGNCYHEGKTRTSHRVAYELHYGVTLGKEHVLHICDNKPCCNPLHLELGDHKKNMRDAWARGLNHKDSKLTPEQREDVRSSTEPRKVLAERYDVALSTIYRIRATPPKED